jgi:hypothetical protein
MRKESQAQKVLEHLQKGWSITPLDALYMFGAFRLSAIVYDLKKQGHDIKTDIVEKDGKHFASYSLIKEPQMKLFS